ncbi:MAG: hypothetical protein KAT71_01280 [Gammaproteobacteria bacterium]|nr:hypothetical protein [Gammaproteobacteria bacterium]
MPLFQREKQKFTVVKPQKFINEKELQALIENNLKKIFNCRFIETEFSTGSVHGGRIDSLALSEDNNPVIIEYKAVPSSQLITQSLYYLSWIGDHHGDFEIAAQKAFPNSKLEIDWSTVRVICIAPEYRKYDLHAAQMIRANIELWKYRYYENGVLFLEEVHIKSLATPSILNESNNKNPIMVEAGKKAAITRATGVYNFDQHYEKIENRKKILVSSLREYILSLDESVEEVPKKRYIAYKLSQNFTCMEIKKTKIMLWLKIDIATLNNIPTNCRDMRNTGHLGTGDFQMSLTTEEDVEVAKNFIVQAFNNIGGN